MADDLIPYRALGSAGGPPPESAWSGGARHRQRSPEPDGDGADGAPIDLHKLLFALRRRWWLVAVAVLLAGGAAWYSVRQQPQSYASRAVVQLVSNRALTGGLVSERPEERGLASLFSLTEILSSRAVAAQAVDSVPVGLRVRTTGFPVALLDGVVLADSLTSLEVPLSFADAGFTVGASGREVAYGQAVTVGGLRFTVTRRPAGTASGAVRVLSRERAIDQAIARLGVSPRRQTTLIDVDFTAAEPATATRAVNAFVQAFQAVDASLAQQQIRRRRAFIEEQLGTTDAQLAQAELALSRFRSQQQAYSSQEKFSAERRELVALDGQRQELDAERRLAASLLAVIERGNPVEQRRALNMLASSSAGATPVVARLYTQLVGYESSRAEVTSGPSGKAETNRDVLRLDTLVANTREQLLDAVQAHVALLDARLASLDDLRRENERALRAVPATEVEETRLSQSAEVLRRQAEMLRAEYQRARIAEAAATGQVEIVDLATGARLVRTGGLRVIAFSLLLGLLVGCGLAVGLEALDRSIKSRDVLERQLRLPLLATVPRIMTVDPGRRRPSFLRMARGPRRADVERRRNVALAAASATRAPSSEAFRQLRTNLLYAGGGRALRSIVVTSAAEGEGKTSVAVNLAVAFAQQRLRVLLVDCDLLASRLHRVFGVPAGPGLQQVVLEHLPPAEALRATPVAGLFLMTAGTSCGDGSEVLGTPRLRALLNDLAHDFDVVILDSAPVLAVSDSLILSVSADSVLLVVRAGATKIADAMEALRHLDDVGARVAGAVLNDPDERVRQYGGYYYSYGYAKQTMAGV